MGGRGEVERRLHRLHRAALPRGLVRRRTPDGGWLASGLPFWGRGLATEGATASLRYGFEELGLDRIISIAVPENLASRRVMEKLGMTLCGETRFEGSDVVWYAVERQVWEASRA